MLRVKRGDRGAFDELCSRIRRPLLVRLYRLVGNWDTAEDLTQETLLRVYRSRGRYRPTARFATWLQRISRNLATTELKKRGRRRQLGETHSVDFEVVAAEFCDSSGEACSDRLHRQERGAILRRAIDSLGGRQRAAVWLFHYECMSYEEIAGRLGTTVPATKSLLVRSRATLRHRLSPSVSLL
jgi:RNA polymerase sigma-70 factor (ECF subfamily)